MFVTRSNYLVLTIKEKLLPPEQSLDRLKNASKPKKEVSPLMVHISSPHVKSERNKEKKKQRFTALHLCKFTLNTHHATKRVNPSIASKS